MAWTTPYLKAQLENILEWGCGVGRIVRHLPAILKGPAVIHACDINEGMIAWDKAHLGVIQFTGISGTPSLPYADQYFDLVFAISVFTHIVGKDHGPWNIEMNRVLRKGGVFLFTTHGNQYTGQLSGREAAVYIHDGYYTREYRDKGHRMMTTYNEPERIKGILAPYFELLEYHDGKADPRKTGVQDLWIVAKK